MSLFLFDFFFIVHILNSQVLVLSTWSTIC